MFCVDRNAYLKMLHNSYEAFRSKRTPAQFTEFHSLCGDNRVLIPELFFWHTKWYTFFRYQDPCTHNAQGHWLQTERSRHNYNKNNFQNKNLESITTLSKWP